MDTCNHFCEAIGNNFKRLTKTQVRNLVCHACKHAFGKDAISKVKSPYPESNKIAFLCHHASFDDEKRWNALCAS